MISTFYETPFFTRRITQRLDDESYRHLQNDLRENPVSGEVMQGCGGLRKLRLEEPRRGKGKRGGLRIIYLHVPEARCVYFVTVYGKDE